MQRSGRFGSDLFFLIQADQLPGGIRCKICSAEVTNANLGFHRLIERILATLLEGFTFCEAIRTAGKLFSYVKLSGLGFG